MQHVAVELDGVRGIVVQFDPIFALADTVRPFIRDLVYAHHGTCTLCREEDQKHVHQRDDDEADEDHHRSFSSRAAQRGT